MGRRDRTGITGVPYPQHHHIYIQLRVFTLSLHLFSIPPIALEYISFGISILNKHLDFATRQYSGKILVTQGTRVYVATVGAWSELKLSDMRIIR